MKPITKEQRQAIRRVWQRHMPLKSGETPQALARAAGFKFYYDEETNECGWFHPATGQEFPDAMGVVETLQLDHPMDYRSFRKTVLEGYDCLMVQVSGMWLGIEKDGYTHS